MRPVKIVTDSTCDLNQKEIIDLDISVIPLHVNYKERTFCDGIDITVPELYSMVENEKTLPKTAAISIMEFAEEFKKWINRGYDVIYTGISAAMSSTLNNANLAISELGATENVRAIDSKNLSTGIGLIVLKAAKMAKNGDDLISIANYMEDVRERVRSQFFIDTFDYLYKGGRCSGMAKVFGSMLKIKPIIAVRDGKMEVASKPLGHNRARKGILEMVEHDLDRIDREVVMVTHSIADEDAEYLTDSLHKMGIENVMVTKAGCVISSHCGPGTIGILYILNK